MMFSFKRPHLAKAYCDALEGKGIHNARSGLFLAGPRRVGKSTFLIDDLIPEITQRNWVHVYVDLWADKNADPANLIAEAIKNKIASHEKTITKLMKSVKLNKINIAGTFVFDFTKPGLPENMTIADALSILGNIANKPIVLIVDEAQHALTTQAGLNMMFAIKSARDQLKNSNNTLMLVFTGSNRDKLAHLVFKKDQPFFGSDITSFPLLSKEYTDAFTQQINQVLAPNNQFTSESMWYAFQMVGHRPEILNQIAGRIALSGEATQLTQLLEEDAHQWHTRLWSEYESDFNGLNLLQKAILEMLIDKGNKWLPFSEESINFYKKMINQDVISTATVQTAIQSLRERNIIWQSGRGSYALEDENFGTWYKYITKEKPIYA